MNNGILAIMDSEEEYAIKLADYFRLKSGLDYNVQVFSNIFTYMDFEKEHPVDILILSEAFSDYISELVMTGQIFILSEGSIDINLKEYSPIYKYQSTESIVRDVMTNYANVAPPVRRITINVNKSKLISIYSPIKRCGKTTFSVALGMELARSSKVLLISLEENSALQYLFDIEQYGDLSDLIYFYRQIPDNLDKKILSALYSIGNLSILPTMRTALDFKYISIDEWLSFIRDISMLGLFDFIVLDISDSVTDSIGFLNDSDEFLCPMVMDEVSNQKLNNYKCTLMRMGHEDILNRMEDIFLPMPEKDLFKPGGYNSLSDSDFYRKAISLYNGIEK